MSTRANVVITATDRTKRAFMSVQQSMTRTQRGIDRLVSGFGLLKGAILGLGLVRFGQDIGRAGLSLAKMQTALRTVAGSAEAAAQEFDFVKGVAKSLGLNLESVAGSYVKLTAAAKGTALEGDQTKKIFVSVAEASRALGLSAYETEGALNAIQQMMSKGKVQAEELRGQLGERLPGAFKLAARAMGVTEQELNKLLETGKVTANDLLPKLADALHNEFGEGAKTAAKGAAASFERFKTEVFLLKAAISEVLLPALQSITEWATGGGLNRIVNAFNDIRAVLAGLIAMGIKPFNQELARSFMDLGVEIYESRKQAEGLADGFDRNMDSANGLFGPIIDITGGVKELGEETEKTTEKFALFTERLDKVGGTISDMQLKTANERLEEIAESVDKGTESLFDMDEALKQVQNNIQSGFSDLFYDVFSGKGIDSVKDFAKRVLDIFKRLIADIAAAWAASKIFGIPMMGGGGLGGLINGGGIGGAIGQGTGIGGSIASSGIGKAISTGLTKIGTAIKGIFTGGSSAGAFGAGAGVNPATMTGGLGKGLAGLGGFAIPAAIFGGALLGTQALAASDAKEVAKYTSRYQQNFGGMAPQGLGQGGSFLGAFENGAGAVDEMYVAVSQQLNKALEQTGLIVRSLNLQFTEAGDPVRRLIGDVDGVKAALEGAKVRGFEFAGSLETAIEKGNGLRVSIEGDAEVIKQKLEEATAAGVGGFKDLEVTGSGVSALLTGDIAQWNKLLQQFVNSAVASAVSGVSSLGNQAGEATKKFIELAGAASRVSVGGGGRAAQVDPYRNLPKFADGGITSGPSIAGEAGPEAVIPLRGGSVPVTVKGGMSNAETNRLLSENNRLLRRMERKSPGRII